MKATTTLDKSDARPVWGASSSLGKSQSLYSEMLCLHKDYILLKVRDCFLQVFMGILPTDDANSVINFS